ncbi:MAG: hypothetical protein OXI83_10405 [Gemmatimonadota bacterium]|nr:hypothetical protein [Gemmatimonadota bacterium]
MIPQTLIADSRKAAAKDGPERREVGAKDRDGAEGESVPRRRPPEGKAPLVAKGIQIGKNRVLRLMRVHGLLAPVRRAHPC